MSAPLRIGLMFTNTFAYSRRVQRGIRRYVETRPDWLLTSIPPQQKKLQRPGSFRLDGLLVSVTTKSVERVLASWRRPLVNTSGVLKGSKFPRVTIDDAQVGRLAAAHFLERGLSHFACVGRADYFYSATRGEAFCQAVREAGYKVAYRQERALATYQQLSRRWDLQPELQKWLRALPKPVGVFVPSDLWGVQVGEACRECGLRVPEDVALLGVGDDDLYCEMTRPPLSSIILPTEQIGYEAAALLDRMMGGKSRPREPILLPPIGVATRRSTEVLAIDDADVVSAVRYIREHAHLPLGVADVIRQVPVGRRTLERRCRTALGWGLAEEIRRTKLARARHLLAQTNLPLKVVAEQAGFSEYHHLAVAFRREVGITPTAYRRRMHHPGPQRP